MPKKTQPKIKKSARRAAARRSVGLVMTTSPFVPWTVTSQKVQRENAVLHKTSAVIAQDARGLERLMDRKRWSHTG